MMTNKERERAYGKAIWETSRADEGTISATGANIVARAVMAVADAEQAALVRERDEARAEVERLRGELAYANASRQASAAEAKSLRDDWGMRLERAAVVAGQMESCVFGEVRTMASHLRAALASVPAPTDGQPECTCGYGGFHEELNPRCDKAVAEGTARRETGAS